MGSLQKGCLVITGCNGGLGKTLVSQFLASPESGSYKGLFGVRDASKADQLKQLVNEASNPSEHEVVSIDLSALQSVRAAAKDINERVKAGTLPPIRGLVLNAAIQFTDGQKFNADGWETTFAVNYAANFLLVLLLLPSMDKDMGRIVIVSSWTHDVNHELNAFIQNESHKTIVQDLDRWKKPAPDTPGDQYNAGMRRYGASKTLIVTLMYELQRRLYFSPDLTNISVLAVDPGTMATTNLLGGSPLGTRVMVHYIIGPLTPLWSWFSPNGYFRTTIKSANDVLTATFDESRLGKHPRGFYFNGNVIALSSPETRDEDKQKMLWAYSVKLVGIKQQETAINLE